MTDKMTKMRGALLVLALALVIASGAFALNAVYSAALTSGWALLGFPAVFLGLNALGNTITGWYFKPMKEEAAQNLLKARESQVRLAVLNEVIKY